MRPNRQILDALERIGVPSLVAEAAEVVPGGEAMPWNRKVVAVCAIVEGLRCRVAQLELDNFRQELRIQDLQAELAAAATRERFLIGKLKHKDARAIATH